MSFHISAPSPSAFRTSSRSSDSYTSASNPRYSSQKSSPYTRDTSSPSLSSPRPFPRTPNHGPLPPRCGHTPANTYAAILHLLPADFLNIPSTALFPDSTPSPSRAPTSTARSATPLCAPAPTRYPPAPRSTYYRPCPPVPSRSQAASSRRSRAPHPLPTSSPVPSLFPHTLRP